MESIRLRPGFPCSLRPSTLFTVLMVCLMRGSEREFGAFVDIGAERSGLVHISRLADGFVAAPGVRSDLTRGTLITKALSIAISRAGVRDRSLEAAAEAAAVVRDQVENPHDHVSEGQKARTMEALMWIERMRPSREASVCLNRSRCGCRPLMVKELDCP